MGGRPILYHTHVRGGRQVVGGRASARAGDAPQAGGGAGGAGWEEAVQAAPMVGVLAGTSQSDQEET